MSSCKYLQVLFATFRAAKNSFFHLANQCTVIITLLAAEWKGQALSGLLCNGLGLVESHLHFNLAPTCQITHDTTSSTFTPRQQWCWCQAKERFTQARKQRTATANISEYWPFLLWNGQPGASNFSTLQYIILTAADLPRSALPLKLIIEGDSGESRVSCYRKDRSKYRMHRYGF